MIAALVRGNHIEGRPAAQLLTIRRVTGPAVGAYSSLATLHAFPFDKIKLDRAFVKRLPNDAAAAAIVRTVLALGSSLGMPVLAEGIETEAQWHFLAREGCAKGQGYLFAKPVGLSQLPAAIEAAARFVRDESLHIAALPRTAVAG
jgi:predicted signal transduction protein with EAL and GGDEF domain